MEVIDERAIQYLSENVEALYIIANNIDLIKNLLDIFSDVENITYITLPLYIMKNWPVALGEKNSKIKSFSQNKKYSVFVDFEGSNKISTFEIDDKKKIKPLEVYWESNEWNSALRRSASKIVFYRYNGPIINSGYWKFFDGFEGYNFLKLSKWGNVVQSIKEPTSEFTSLRNIKENKKFLKELKTFVCDFVTNVLMQEDEYDENFVNGFIQHINSEESTRMLISSFTHITVDPIVNYERNEYRGDRMMISLFSEAMIQKFTRMTSAEASGFALAYMSAKYQSVFSEDLKLFKRMFKHPIIRSSTKLKTDIFESFIGYLTEVSNSYIPGSQFLFVYNVVAYIVDSISFNRDLIRGKYKQQVIQILEMSGFSKDDLVMEVVGSDISLVCSAKLIIFFQTEKSSKSTGVESLNVIQTLTKKYDPYKETRNEACEDVWHNVLRILNQNGITFETKSSKIPPFFGILKRDHRATYDAFVEKISVLVYERTDITPEEIKNILVRIKFSSNKFEGYVCMYLSPNSTSEEGISLNGITSLLKSGGVQEREDETYQDLEISLTRTLAAVEFSDENLDLKGFDTPFNVCKYRCIEVFNSEN